jgi:chromatin remodeling complex protein RSC6
MDQLVEALLRAKESRNIESDYAFAKLLDIDSSTWSLIKSGKRRIGNKVLSKIIIKLPELTVEAMTYMKQQGSK